jgi:putative MATE family efflux protein
VRAVDFSCLKEEKQKGKMAKEKDLIHGPLAGSMATYALPVALTGILQQLFNAADVAVVGRLVGTEAMAAVGTDGPLVAFIINFFAGLTLGSTVVIATAIGERDEEKVHRGVHTSLLLSLITGAMAALISEFAVVPVLGMLDVPSEVFSMAVLYMRIYLAGLPVIVLYNFLTAVFRSAGNTEDPLLALVVSGVINVVLNIFFVAGLGMDVDGVALATVISNAVSSTLLIILLRKVKSGIRLRWQEMRIDRAVMKRILRIGVPSGIQGMIFSIANIIIQTGINSLGTIIMAASSAAFNIEACAYYVVNAFGQTCTTFVGQNNGAGKQKRCVRCLFDALGLDYVFTGAVCAILLIFGRQILSLFNQNPDVIAYGYLRLEIVFFSFLFSIVQEVLSGYLRGYGISALPALLSVVGICGVRIFWIFSVFQRSPDLHTIMLAYPVSNAVTAAVLGIAVLQFHRRRTPTH